MPAYAFATADMTYTLILTSIMDNTTQAIWIRALEIEELETQNIQVLRICFETQ
jgi:hypothetical protein